MSRPDPCPLLTLREAAERPWRNGNGRRKQAAKLHEVGLMLAILLLPPVRRKDLSRIDMPEHLVRNKKKRLDRIIIDVGVKNTTIVEISPRRPHRDGHDGTGGLLDGRRRGRDRRRRGGRQALAVRVGPAGSSSCFISASWVSLMVSPPTRGWPPEKANAFMIGAGSPAYAGMAPIKEWLEDLDEGFPRLSAVSNRETEWVA